MKRTPANRDRILEETIKLADEHGWQKVTVRAIANRLDYKPPVLYQFFDSKDDLIRHTVKEGFKRLTEDIKESIKEYDSPSEKLIALAETRFEFGLKNKSLHSMMFSTGSPFWLKSVVFEGMFEVKKLVESLIQKISGRSDDCSDLVTNFIALIKGYTYFATELPPEDSKSYFFSNQSPELMLREAMIRFIKSIQSDE